jgi:micrococcal nuclease
MRRLLLFVLILGVSLGLYALPPYQPTVEVVVVRVIDGDTLEVSLSRVLSGQLPPNWHSPVRVRLIGIDCPEMDTPLGPKAKGFLTNLVDEKYLYLEFDKDYWDPYGRLLAYVYLDPEGYQMVNAILVALGFAEAKAYPPNTRYKVIFEDLEAVARAHRLGMWGAEETAALLAPSPTTAEVPLKIIQFHYDAAGNDNYNLNDEYFVLQNISDSPIDMSGWTVTDEAGHVFRFPSGFILAPGATVTVYTGCGTRTVEKLFWCSRRAIWNNDGDTLILKDRTGQVVLRYTY